MRYIRPIFYNAFSCTADRCPDTCCAGWQIMIDDASLERYGHEQGKFGKRLHDSIDWQEGAFCQFEGRCAFLNEQNLCDLYTALGSDALCETCSRYPRHVEEYEGLREWSLSLSCPVAAEMILSVQGFPAFVTEEDDREDELEDEFEDFDLMLFTQLEDARNAVFEKLKGEASLQEVMDRALALAEQMQDCVGEDRFYDLEEVIRKYAEEPASVPWPVQAPEVGGDYPKMRQLYESMYGLERLRPEWTQVLEETYETLYGAGQEIYARRKAVFRTYLQQNPEAAKCWENTGLQLFVFFVYTYFCGAAYDGWIYSKMALAVRSVEFIRELLLACFVNNGEKLEFQNYLELSYRYAREIEHSDPNLNALEEAFMSEKYEI